MADSLKLQINDTYEFCNGTQIDGVLFKVVGVYHHKSATYYEVRAHHPPIYFADETYFIEQTAIDDYVKKGQLLHDPIRECSI